MRRLAPGERGDDVPRRMSSKSPIWYCSGWSSEGTSV